MTIMDLRDIYRKIPHRYESTNHLLTFGLDIVWRRIAARAAIRTNTIPPGQPKYSPARCFRQALWHVLLLPRTLAL